MRILKHLNVAQEAIAFQGSAFHKELTLAIEPYIGVGTAKSDWAKLESKIERLITKVTGANIDISILEGYDPCILIHPTDVNSIFNNYWGAIISNPDEMKKLRKERERAGTVDLENSRVTGAFAQSFSTIYTGPSYFTSGKFTAGELSAIFLHEVGHYFGICEMLDRTAGTNQVLASVDRLLKNNSDIKTREIILQYAGEELGLDDRVIQKAIDSHNDTVSSTILVVEAYQKQFRTDQKKSYYEQNSPEYTSDEFAARHGASRDLVTALDKLYSAGFLGPIQKRGTAAYFAIEILKIAVMMVATYASVATGLPMIMAMGLSFMLGDDSEAGEPTYDSPLNRLNRIRRQLVEYAKQPGLRHEIAITLLEDVKVTDQLLSQYNNHRDLMTFLSDTLSFTGNSKNRNYQVELEKLVLNDLFLKALEFKHQ